MKKFITLSLVSGLLLSFATGCAGNNNPVINDQNKPIDILYDNPIKPGDQTDNEPVEKPRVYTEEETLHIDVTKDIKEQLNSKPQAKCIIIDNGTGTELPWDNETRGIVSFRRSIFYSYKNIEKIVLPESFEVIEIDAFSGCSSLREIVIPNSVKKIRSAAFHDCTLLKDIYIPASVTEIEDSVFRGCTSLESIWVDKENQYYSSDEHGVLFDKDKSVLIRCPQSIGLSSYTIPEGVTEIANGAFDEGVTLSEINISDDVVYLNGAFSGCVSLEVITVDKNNLNYSSDENGILFDKNKTKLIRCPENIKLLSYSIPDCVKEIEEYAFSECSASEINLPQTLTYINQAAFQGCVNLCFEELNLPELEYLGECAFADGVIVKSVKNLGKITELRANVFRGNTTMESIILPDTIADLPRACFKGFISLRICYLPNSITNLNSNCFSGCANLQTINLSKIENINVTAYETIFTSKKLPENLIFDNLKKINSVYNSNGVFHETNVQKVEFPNLESVSGRWCFNGKQMSGNEEIVIGDKITKISGSYGDYLNAQINNLVLKAVTPPELTSALSSGKPNNIYVPDASVEAYQSATNWNAYASQIKPLSEYVES